MNTLKSTTRMRLLTLTACATLALTLGGVLSGCSTASGGRGGPKSKMKTFLSVGDKPLPVVSGEPGSTIAADDAPLPTGPRRNGRAEGRISGRVFGADGRPVPEARVRLAVNDAAGGKVVRASTDRSGAFTLHGLRPESDYTVIAEWEDDSGVQTGRSNARASDTDVKIRLRPDDPNPAPAAAPTRVNRVSEREPTDDEPIAPSHGSRSGGVNEEDLPPAAEAESMAPTAAEVDPPRRPRAATAAATPWSRGPRRAPALAGSEPKPDAEGAPQSEGPDAEADDDVPNPLPPAIERGRDQGQAEAAPRGNLLRMADASPRPAATDPFAESPTATRPVETPTTEPPADVAPGAIVVEPETFAPVVVHDAFSDQAPSPAAAAATDPFITTRTPERSHRAVSATAANDPAPGSTPESAPGRRRPTWKDVASTTTALPPLEGRTAQNAAKADAGVARRSHSTATDAGGVATASAPVPLTIDPNVALCEYDDHYRRMIDFRLPGLDGKPVRFRELDADLVLLDFWGTWCQPCLKSIPHLVALQERLGKKLVVVGVACEQAAPDKAAAKVSEAVETLKVNYPVLLSRNDGSCPLQAALHVQAFPTMVLLDREGRVLWRDQGATPATLARLDRFLATPPKDDDPAPR